MQRLILEYYTDSPYGGCVTHPILYSSKEELLDYIEHNVKNYIEQVFLKAEEYKKWRDSGKVGSPPERISNELNINHTTLSMDDFLYHKEYNPPTVYTIDEYFLEVESKWFENNV